MPGSSLRPARGPRAAAGSRRAWGRPAASACDAAGMPLEVISTRLSHCAAGRKPRGRRARGALCGARRATSTTGERLLTAHHRDDQLETVLIQLLRGAGVAGLAAMPALAPLGRGWQLAAAARRRSRRACARTARQRALAWYEDPMNEALRFDRGWLRARVLPAIRERWPAACATVARSAAHLAEASRLLAERRGRRCGGVLDEGRLSLAALGTPLARTPGQPAALVAATARACVRRRPRGLPRRCPSFLSARRDCGTLHALGRRRASPLSRPALCDAAVPARSGAAP